MFLLVILFQAVANFFGLWILVSFYSENTYPDKLKRIGILSLVVTIVGLIWFVLGILGIFVAIVLNSFIISRFLNCSVWKSASYSVGLTLFTNFIMFDLLTKVFGFHLS
jgi:hypothetical protein